MLATRIRQKDGIFYFASYPAKDVLDKVRFISRFYGEGEEIAPHTVPQNDEIAQFIARIERTDEAFQRQLSRAKVRALRNFYEMAVSQPPIPGHGAAVHRRDPALHARPTATPSATCRSRRSRYLIIDGQHRLAALRFYLKEHPAEASTHQRAVRHFRRPQRGFRGGDVRHHQFDADAHQQEPPGRPLRARVLGRPRPALRRAAGRRPLQARTTARCSTASTASAAAASRTSGSCRRSFSTSCTAG